MHILIPFIIPLPRIILLTVHQGYSDRHFLVELTNNLQTSQVNAFFSEDKMYTEY
jgi:hypothetical protein